MAVRTPTIGNRPHLVTLARAGAIVPDGKGGWSQDTVPLTPPTWYCSIESAGGRTSEPLTAGTPVPRASHVLRGPYHPGITTDTQVSVTDAGGIAHLFHVSSVTNVEFRDIETLAYCEEQPAEAVP